ncbi:MAG TPA: LacI family DNA-binding transcriptional regulator [Jatrophihabitantaceae bacterium]|jgi:DNA-binding LacI/PurR family transcriptional regulator
MPGSARRVTIADVAARAGVSAGAVSFALNDRPGVAASTRRRILEVAGELGWQPSHRARSLSRSTSFAFGLVLARSTELVGADPFFPAFVSGVNTVLVAHERSLLFTVVPDTDSELATYQRLAAEQRVDGVILPDLRVHDSRPRLVADLGLPAITLGRPDRIGGDRRVGSVSVNDVVGMREVVRSLVTAGHERIAHVTGPRNYLHVRHRRNAWADELDTAGLPRGACVYTDFSAGAGARATEQLLQADERPTAITYTNDVMAIAGLAVLQRHGLRVPRDISITGFDDTELAHHIEPPLTTVRTAVAQWGERVAVELLTATGGSAPQHIDLEPARMVVRASVAAPPARSKARKGAPPR